MTDTEKTAQVVISMMNDTHAFLNFTSETSEDFADNHLPTLHFALWVGEDNLTRYEFWEKPTTINQVLHAQTALSENTKMQSLSNEVIRRMRNTSELLDNRTRVRIIDNFAQKMKNSGYKLEIIRRVIFRGLKGYERQKER